jgi:HD-GYP domain-containing protein (c-di-GMP phosphodiesterase class II)
MRLIPTDRLKEGIVVAKNIYRENGSVLIGKGMKLKKKYIEKIKELGISKVYVEDPMLFDIEANDIIKEETRLEGIALVKKIMDNLSFSDEIPIEKVKEKVDEIIEQLVKNDNIIMNLAEMRAIDNYTFGHSVNVCVLSLVTGICMGYTKEKLLELGVGAILHDIGKVKIPGKILNKPGKLTTEEYEVIKRHTEYGYEILKKNIGISDAASSIALYHHERFDGKGYPYGVKGEKIHQFARITTIADVYDALTTDRVYKRRVQVHKAVEYLISMGGHQFDYNIVRKFLSNIAVFPLGTEVLLNTGEKGYIVKVRRELPTRPVVRIVCNSNGKKLSRAYDIDLLRNSSIVIIDTVNDI